MSERVLVLLLVALFCPAAKAAGPASTPKLDAEREALIRKLVAGEDLEASIAAYKALVARRDPVVPTSIGAKEEARQRQEAIRALREEWRRAADSEVAWRCRLSADPAHPRKVDGWRGDWGRITRREQIALPPKNALDEGETWTVYEVKGQRRTYRFRAEGFGALGRRRFEAEVGDLALVCDGGVHTVEALPPPWREDFQRSGFAVRLSEVPRIARKRRWDPVHITTTDLFWAVKDVKWRYPEGVPVLCAVEIAEDLGEGRYLIQLTQGLTALIEVPPPLRDPALLVPGRTVWAILGHARFDPAVKKLVMTALDLEADYIEEVPSPAGGQDR